MNDRLHRWVRVLGVVTTLGMFVVLVMGATVTNTGSEHGCGRSWPLCHGQLIPQFAVSTFIEFSHRAVVGVEIILILALAAGALLLYHDRREMRILVPLMVAFLFLQAGLGAWAVMAPQLSAVLALHFGVSLIAFASVLLTTVSLFQAETPGQRQLPVPAGFRRYAWGLAAYSYIVVYVGAYVRHTNADDGCKGWPLCNGALIPHLAGATGAVFVHRIVAAVLILGVAFLVLWSRRLPERPDLVRGAWLTSGAIALQALTGALVVFTDMDLFSALAHAAGAGLLFGSLSYLCLQVLPQSQRQPAGQRTPLVSPAGD